VADRPDDQNGEDDATAESAEQDPGLWKPRPPTEDCPLCLVPLPLDNGQSVYWACCGMSVCRACKAETERALRITNRKRKDTDLPPMVQSCAFCREPGTENDSDLIKRYEERVGKGDLSAMMNLAVMYRDGESGLVRDEAKVLELELRAADLGSAWAHGSLGSHFIRGRLGVIRDEEKARAYWEGAVKKGCVISRHNLGALEAQHERHDLAMKHFKLAAVAGFKPAVKPLWKYFLSDELTKAELEATLRAHKEACDEMNSEDRERFVASEKAQAGNDCMLQQIYALYYEGLMDAKELKKKLKACHNEE